MFDDSPFYKTVDNTEDYNNLSAEADNMITYLTTSYGGTIILKGADGTSGVTHKEWLETIENRVDNKEYTAFDPGYGLKDFYRTTITTKTNAYTQQEYAYIYAPMTSKSVVMLSATDYAKLMADKQASEKEAEKKAIEEDAAIQQQEEDAQKQLADLISGNQSTTLVGMKNFSTVLNSLNNKFCNGRAVYTMYFKMNLTAGGVLVDTTSQDWLENNLISFTHKMNGSGEANTFTLEILYKPDDRNIRSITLLEQKLLTACAIYANSQTLKEEEEIYSNCSFQYGYGDDSSLRSPTYYGTIMDYDSKIENGNLRYTITGYCGLYSAKEYRISAKSEYLTDKNGAEIVDPISYIARIIEIEFGDKGLYDYKLINIQNKESVKYPGEDYKKFNQKNIFQVIRDILSGCMTSDQYEKMSGSSDDSGDSKTIAPNQKQIFSYYIDNKASDTAKYGTIYIYKMESLYGEENAGITAETIQPDCGITFSWFAPSSGAFNHIVKDWHPQYEGSILISMATTLIKGKKSYYTVTDDGSVKKVTSLGAARLGLNADDDNARVLSTIQEYDNWAFCTQYPYKASMTLLGVPCEVPMTGKIKVIAKMGNENHHSSGVYMVLGKTDKINSSGFFTELELFKFVPGYNPAYTADATAIDDIKNRIATIQNEINRIEAELAAYEQMLNDGLITPEIYKSHESQLGSKINSLKQQIADLQNSLS